MNQERRRQARRGRRSGSLVLYVLGSLVLVIGGAGCSGGSGSVQSLEPVPPEIPAAPAPDPEPEPEPNPVVASPPPPPPVPAYRRTIQDTHAARQFRIDDKHQNLEIYDVWKLHRNGCEGTSCNLEMPGGDVRVSSTSFMDYGQWLSHSGYFVGTHPVNGDTVAMSMGFGTPSETFPAPAVDEEFTWTGSMVGVDVRASQFAGDYEYEELVTPTFGNKIVGDARMIARGYGERVFEGQGVKAAGVYLSLEFTNVRNTVSGQVYDNSIPFSALSYNSEGAFWTGGPESARSVRGRFYGPNHEEAAGTFSWALGQVAPSTKDHHQFGGDKPYEHIIGAFGVTRQR